MIVPFNNFEFKGKIAGFDYDHTIVKPSSGGTFPKNEDDWMWLRKNIPEILQNSNNDGYSIVIFTNQSKEFKLKQLHNVLGSLPFPTCLVYETDKTLQKPNCHMFVQFIEKFGDVDINKSFFVGDALGREGDFADSDKQFAINCGLKWKSPEEFFPFAEKEVVDIEYPNNREIVIMMGYPGSGKSTFVEKYFGDKDNYEIIHGDELKTEAKMKKALKNGILNDKSVVIDATHSSKKKRKVFIDIAKKEDIPVRIIRMTTTIEESMSRNLERTIKVPKIALYMYRKHYEEPTIDEGFYQVIEI